MTMEVPDPPESKEFWLEQAVEVRDLDGLAAALYQLHRKSGALEDDAEARRGFVYMCDEYPPAGMSQVARWRVNEVAIAGFDKYVNAVADGAERGLAGGGQQQMKPGINLVGWMNCLRETVNG